MAARRTWNLIFDSWSIWVTFSWNRYCLEILFFFIRAGFGQKGLNHFKQRRQRFAGELWCGNSFAWKIHNCSCVHFAYGCGFTSFSTGVVHGRGVSSFISDLAMVWGVEGDNWKTKGWRSRAQSCRSATTSKGLNFKSCFKQWNDFVWCVMYDLN